VFAVIALPAVITDFAVQFVTGSIHSALDYKEHILWNWGGIIQYARMLAVLAGACGIYFVYRLSQMQWFNPNGKPYVTWISVGLIATNFYYFEYSHFFKHWIFIVALLLAQLYVIGRISDEEVSRRRKGWWITHAIIIAISFGISYTSLLFHIVWGGLLVQWMIHKNYRMVKEWFMSMLLALGLMLIIFWWHPYALLRMFRGGATIPFGGVEVLGFSYFGKLVLLNHVGIWIAAIVAAVTICRKNILQKIKHAYAVISGLLLVAVSQYIFLSVQPGLNREGRYMLPTIVCLLLLAAYILGIYFSQHREERKRITDWVIMASIVFTVVFQLVGIARWVYVYAQGPAEQHMISDVQAYTAEYPENKTLIVQYYIAGAPHTPEAYKDYMNRFGRSEVNLFKELLLSPVPEGTTPINAYYIRPDQFVVTDMDTYNHVVYLNVPRLEINQFDYFDEDITRLWWYDTLSPHYVILK
jgi:hypothetical protein